jgi:hypothetical protein
MLFGYDSAMYAGYGPSFDATLNAARPDQQDLQYDHLASPSGRWRY